MHQLRLLELRLVGGRPGGGGDDGKWGTVRMTSLVSISYAVDWSHYCAHL